RVRFAHELHAETEQTVQQREKTRYRVARTRFARIEPQHAEHHDALEHEFIQLRRMARFVIQLSGEIHLIQLVVRLAQAFQRARDNPAPRRVGMTTPQLAADEISESTQTEPDRYERCNEIDRVEEMNALAARPPPAGEQHAEQATVERHAAFPDTQQRE